MKNSHAVLTNFDSSWSSADKVWAGSLRNALIMLIFSSFWHALADQGIFRMSLFTVGFDCGPCI